MAYVSSFSSRIVRKLSRLSRQLIVVGFCLAAGLSSAQDSAPATDQDSTVTYPASYFAQFDPYSVSDMLDRIPGITVARGGGQGGGGGAPGRSQGSNRRGRGAGGDQVLINGRRIGG